MRQNIQIRGSLEALASLGGVREKVQQKAIAQLRIVPTLCFDSYVLLRPLLQLMKCALLQATDKTFVDKLNSTFKGSLHFQPARGRVLGFSIMHYAGKVCTVCRKNAVVYVGGGGSVALTNKALILRNVWSEDDTNRSDMFQWIAS